MNKKALVVMSGGADSCICLFWALREFDEVEAITFDYGQRHKIETECARDICTVAGVPHNIVKLSGFDAVRFSALLDTEGEITTDKDTGLPTTFVPGRNAIFLTYAAAYAYSKGIQHIVTGTCQTDFSGYPDCRDNSIKALQVALTLCLDKDVYIHTPLMWLTKAESIKLADELGAFTWLDMTHTCYKGMRPACGECPACKLRLQGFKEAGYEDPLSYVG